MARTVVTHITDDLDGSKDATEVKFGFDGVEYVIDLSKKNRSALEQTLRPYIEAGTKVQSRGGRATKAKKSASSRRDLQEVRTWAKSQGIEVSARGRVPRSVVEQFDSAHA